MTDEPDVTVPPDSYRATPEMQFIYDQLAKLLNSAISFTIRAGIEDPKVGREMAISMAFSAVIREALRHYDTETVVKMLHGYAESTPEGAAMNKRAQH